MDVLRWIGYFVFALYVLTSLWLLFNGLIQLHLLWYYKKGKVAVNKINDLKVYPYVTIQVPVYNEKYVIEQLLHSLSQFEYPKDKFDIQVLDDSTDETSTIIDRKAEILRKAGFEINVLRRNNRKHYKAGALQYGLSFCRGEFIAIFDADFQPPAFFLQKLLAKFEDPKVGLVQARWTHLNKEENYLTQIQTFLLDTHFSVEQSGRAKAGYCINFCGTAGIWRKQCIEDAGGWDGAVLSEDLDLSYRAQLKGWKLEYDQSTEVPAELPSAMEAFKIQQFRWTKGMAQTSRKTIKSILTSDYPALKKLHAVCHLLGSFVFVCLFINALLTVPLLFLRNIFPEFVYMTRFSLFTSFNLVALTLVYYNGTMSARKNGNSFWTYYPAFLVIYMGLSVQNAIAVMQGLAGKASAFIRTPKASSATVAHNMYLERRVNWITLVELGVFFYFIYGISVSFYLGDYFMLLFFLMISYGVGFIVYESLRHLFKKPKTDTVPMAVKYAVTNDIRS